MERVCRPSDKLRAEPGSRSAFAYGDHMYLGRLLRTGPPTASRLRWLESFDAGIRGWGTSRMHAGLLGPWLFS
jgi:hypothetical protein